VLVPPFVSHMEHYPAAEPDRVLATVLFTDIVASTEHTIEVDDSGENLSGISARGLLRQLMGRQNRHWRWVVVGSPSRKEANGGRRRRLCSGPRQEAPCARPVAALILAVGLAVLPAGLAVAQPTPGAGRNCCRSTLRRRAVRCRHW
jgi:hypothetical protein